MGQKLSSSRSSSEISLSKKESRNLKLKTKKATKWSKEKINVDVPPKLEQTFADAEKLDDGDTRKNDENDDDDDDDDDDNSTVNSLAYPSIAELSNFTALSMMRNLEDVSLKNQVNEDRSMDDDFNEKCFNTINYEDMPTLLLVENTTSLRRDSSTCTNEIKELSCESLDGVVENVSCKNSQQNIVYHEMKISTNEEETLEAKLKRVERERDDALSKLRMAETRCEAYEEESKSLEASMESMEDKLRIIIDDLRSEVAKSKDLERKLSSSFKSSVDILQDGEKLIPVLPS